MVWRTFIHLNRTKFSIRHTTNIKALRVHIFFFHLNYMQQRIYINHWWLITLIACNALQIVLCSVFQQKHMDWRRRHHWCIRFYPGKSWCSWWKSQTDTKKIGVAKMKHYFKQSRLSTRNGIDNSTLSLNKKIYPMYVQTISI
jgi:hypothetical protein